jgi:hypothetical protein
VAEKDYPQGKTWIKFIKAPEGGFQAEPNTKLPHVYVPHDGAVVEVSADLAVRLTMRGVAQIVDPNAAEREKAALEDNEHVAEAVVPKAESKAPQRKKKSRKKKKTIGDLSWSSDEGNDDEPEG